MADEALIERRDERGVFTLTMNRAANFNALSEEMLGVLQAARKAAAQRKLVVLSNYATPDMRRKCLQLGADKVFDKSNEIDALILYCCRLADGSTGSTEFNPLS